jgi:hypothetical protein
MKWKQSIVPNPADLDGLVNFYGYGTDDGGMIWQLREDSQPV